MYQGAKEGARLAEQDDDGMRDMGPKWDALDGCGYCGGNHDDGSRLMRADGKD